VGCGDAVKILEAVVDGRTGWREEVSWIAEAFDSNFEDAKGKNVQSQKGMRTAKKQNFGCDSHKNAVL